MGASHARIPGEFVPLDVNYAHDRAIRQAGPMAELLYIRSLTYARRVKTDGALPDYDLPVFGVGITNLARNAAVLVRVGLWLKTDEGWLIRSFPKWNPLSEAERASRQSRGGSVGNHNRWHRDRGEFDPTCEFCAIGTPIGTDSVAIRSTDSVERIGGNRRVEEKREEKRESDTGMHSSSSYVPREEATA